MKGMNYEQTNQFLNLLNDPAMPLFLGFIEEAVASDKDRLETCSFKDMREVGFLQGRISFAKDLPNRVKTAIEKARAGLETASGREKGKQKEGGSA